MARFTVTNTILASNGTPMAGVAVNIKLMPSGGFTISSREEIVRELNIVANASGVWTANLESNLNISPSGTWYEILEKIPKSYGGNRTWIIGVGGVGGSVYSLLLSEPPSDEATYVPLNYILKTAWTFAPLDNGATGPADIPGGYYSPQYRLFDDTVEMRGLAFLGDSNGTWPATQSILTLPVGFRPPRILRYPVNAVMLGQTVSSCTFAVVNPSGIIQPQLDIKNAHMFFEGISFSTSAT
jgi:hypothetical protein